MVINKVQTGAQIHSNIFKMSVEYYKHKVLNIDCLVFL